MTKREELLQLLRVFADDDGNEREVHEEAEKLLLAHLGDPELTEAWEEASNFWWYEPPA